MEQVVTHLAAAHHLDLSQKGATLMLDVSEQKQQWLITNFDNCIGVTRLKVDKEDGLAPEIDILLEKQPNGWEPVEVVHTDTAWQDYASNVPIDAQGDFSFAALADRVAQDLEQQATTATATTGIIFEKPQT